MTCSTVKKVTEPLDEPERGFQSLMRATLRQHQNESLAIAERNLFDDEVSSSNDNETKPVTPLKSLWEHSLPNLVGFQNPIILPAEQTGRIVNSHDILLIQGTCTFQGLKSENPLQHIKHYLSILDNIQADGASRDTSRLRFFHFSLKGKAKEMLDRTPPSQITTWDQLVTRFLDYFFPIFHDNISQEDRGKLDQFIHFRFSSLTEEEDWNRIEEYIQYQDDLWDNPSLSMNISSITGVIQPTFEGRLKRACKQISYLETPTREIGLRNPYLICDLCGGAHEANECDQNNPTEQVSLSGGYIYDEPSLLRFYQNGDIPPWGNKQKKGEGEGGPKWGIKSKFKDELASFMLEKKFHTKGIGEMLDQHHKEIH
ncbi:zinc finger, CCHC-type containing protein [Tanacetum coccineum]